jgi:hypothetical protein
MRKFLALLFIVICSGAAFAWDDAGHKITTQIAWQNMTPAARERAVALLSSAPENSHILMLMPTDSRALAVRQEQMFVAASTWSDLVRSERFPLRKQTYDKPTWHYTNIFWRQVNGKPEIVSELKPENENVVERLFALEKIVRDTQLPNSERGIALAWILHLAGDIHQPLHTSARVTDLEPKGDQGGNLFLLSPADAPREQRDNLHRLWDSIVSRRFARENALECDSDYIPRLAARITLKHPTKKFAGQLNSAKYDEWAQEGFKLASEELYPANLKRGEAPAENYQKRASEISEERLALAGYRMAELLNKILAS